MRPRGRRLRTFPAISAGRGGPSTGGPPGILRKGLLLGNWRLPLRSVQSTCGPVKLSPAWKRPLARQGAAKTSTSSLSPREHRRSMYWAWADSSRRTHALIEVGHLQELAALLLRNGLRALHPLGAFQLYPASETSKKRLTWCQDERFVTFGHDLWWRTFPGQCAREYPDTIRLPDYKSCR